MLSSGPCARIKICGIRSVDDARAAVAAGADAVGLVFVQRSPRVVDFALARQICAALPPLVMRVGLFMDAPPAFVEAALSEVPLHALQFHGAEPADFCRQWRRPWWKALPMAARTEGEAARLMADYPDADGWVLDGHGPGEPGGQGRRFDWAPLPAGQRERVVLAGGLNPSNVSEALRRSGAGAVDVSSGVETAPGRKDFLLMCRFVEEARRARAT